MKFTIGLVARCLNTAHIRGMGKYLFELLRQSVNHQDLTWYLFSDNVREKLLAPDSPRILRDVFTFRGDRYQLWEQIGLPLHAVKHHVDLLHCTENTLTLWQPKPTVVTLHDTLIWEELKDDLFEKFYFNTLLPAALKRCAAIITISQSSRNDIVAKWPSLESKLNVIPHGISEEFFTEENPCYPMYLQPLIHETAYLLYLGGPAERKRFSWALEIIARCSFKPLKLIACGFDAEARRAAADNLPHELCDRVYFASYLSDAELRTLYRGAQAVLYPTLYEGFGFPAIEAQAAGVPVIFSSLGSLAELIGPLAMVVPPFDLDAWLGALNDALTMGETRIEKARAAKAWAQRFAWSESFDKHLAVYRKAVEGC
ncbi:glycosyltransferase family 4 protein [Allochromatium vinosum]|uniref:glycosyltransferase family 4 protein n=1 Tax=Allochromatium vinosum TaxID=1049 RepID=UPI0019081316|nr:glycosyltransferase family 1 protein [Allochromatium vinosum]MBK1656443.1 hypothetical protein [Allochromatium vinosum]